RRRHTRCYRDWSSDVCSSDLVANAPSWEDNAALAFFETSGRNLLAAEVAAGVGHHVALSVVGTDRLLASGYFRAKMAQENLIKEIGRASCRERVSEREVECTA